MRRLSAIIGLIVLFLGVTVPAFPISLKFDFDGNPDTWENDWTMLPNDTVQVDVWLVDYDDIFTVTTVQYKLQWDSTKLSILNAWPYDTNHGGPWHPGRSYAHLLWNGQYLYQVGSQFPNQNGVIVTGKVKLHTIVIKCLVESVTQIRTAKVDGTGDYEIIIHLNGITDFRNVDYHAQATIHGPSSCELSVTPVLSIVYPGETVQFTPEETGEYCSSPCYGWEIVEEGSTGSEITADGLYIAGESKGVDKIKVTDPCNNNISAMATVSVVPCKISIEPASKTILPHETVQFHASVMGECEEPCFTWEVASGGGTVDENGLYMAGGSPGTSRVRVTDTCNDDISAIATVKVAPCKVTIEPAQATINFGQTLELHAFSSGDCNEPCYTWEVSGLSGSTGDTGDTADTASYRYTAGNERGTALVTVTDNCNDNVSDTATLNVVPGGSTTTTTVPPSPTPETECDRDADCDDGKFCNGRERCIKGRCRSGSNPCPDDELFCTGEERCNEDNDACIQTGDPCRLEGLICDEVSDSCVGCINDADCDDDVFCNGQETCDNGVCTMGGNPCPDDGLYCTGVESCDEANDKCVSSGNPCREPYPICDENLDICKSEPPLPQVLIKPESLLQSRWIPLPALLNIKAVDDSSGGSEVKFDATSVVSYYPVNAFLAFPPLVWDEENIYVLGFLMPLWVTGTLEDVDVTVTTGIQEATGIFKVQLLPFILGE